MKELREKLKRLSIPQLKSLAEDFEIDVSNCRRRNEYIDTIAASGVVLIEDVDTFLSLVGPSEGMTDEGKPLQEEVPSAPEPPAAEQVQPPQGAGTVDDAIQAHLQTEINLRVAEEHLQAIKDLVMKNKHRDVHDRVKQMMNDVSEILKKVELTGYAYILTSTAHILNEMKMSGLDVRHAEDILSSAKGSFSKDFEATRKAISELGNEIERLKNEQVSKIESKLREIEASISQAKQIEAEVDEAEILMNEVRTQFESRNFSECLRLIQEVDEIVQEAHREKIQGITQLVLDVEDLIANAKSIGAETDDAEKILLDAKNAFKGKDYLTCIQNLTKVEEMVSSRLQAKLEEIEKLKEKQKAKIEKRLLALIDEASHITSAEVASALEDKFESVKVALEENNLTRATLLIREAEKELKAAKQMGGTGPEPAPKPAQPGVTPPPQGEKMGEGGTSVPPFQETPPPPPKAELLPLQRPCKWCGYRGVEYYSTGVAKCPGCNRTYQWR